jgi:hypothetical protein
MRISGAAVRRALVFVGVAGALTCFLPAAAASLMTTNLALYDGFGPDAGRWRGSVTITEGPNALGQEVDATVEWAAFAPGKFQDYLDANHFGALDPSALGEVIYAYEVVSVTTAVPGIFTLSVGRDAADGVGTVAPTHVAGTGGQAPTFASDQGTSMLWLFLPPPDANMLQAGEKSSILVYSSIFAPQFDTLQLNAGLVGPFPSPLVASISDRLFTFEIPEPTSLVLVVLGVGAAFAGRRAPR